MSSAMLNLIMGVLIVAAWLAVGGTWYRSRRRTLPQQAEWERLPACRGRTPSLTAPGPRSWSGSGGIDESAGTMRRTTRVTFG